MELVGSVIAGIGVVCLTPIAGVCIGSIVYAIILNYK